MSREKRKAEQEQRIKWSSKRIGYGERLDFRVEVAGWKVRKGRRVENLVVGTAKGARQQGLQTRSRRCAGFVLVGYGRDGRKWSITWSMEFCLGFRSLQCGWHIQEN